MKDVDELLEKYDQLEDELEIQDNDNYQPTSFSKSAFNDENFDMDAFISDLTKRLPLASVLKDLENYGNHLNSQLIELINKDYADFVNLSGNLVGIDKVVRELIDPLSNIEKEVKNIKDEIEGNVLDTESLLEERRYVVKKKETLELFVNFNESLNKIEKLLDIDSEKQNLQNINKQSKTNIFARMINGEQSNKNNSIDFQGASLIERVSSEFNQLKFYLSKGKNLPFVMKMQNRILFIEQTLKEGANSLFIEDIKSSDHKIIEKCLRTFSAIDKIEEAQGRIV
eukprot:TRINITY_DN13002_c0_g1_i1.p1 TRINITY_DN13002_c0_g1~~TRINITY_DN13002_c0_g1_i1.p1  ORF type:complete len:284 (-),score=86.15 TRINITY_DN13002_c0_g1_i1:55-906(-)